MKSYYFILLFIIGFSVVSFAQETDSKQSSDDSYRTIFNFDGGVTKVSGFGAFNINMLSMDSKTAGAMGFDGAVLINRSFYIGMYGRGSFGTPSYSIYKNDSIGNTSKASTFIHMGMIIGANFMAEKPVHFGFSTKFGGGAYMLYNDYNYHYSCTSYNCYENDVLYVGPLFVITPQVDMEMNITDWMKLKVGLGYQWVSSSKYSYMNETSSGVTESRTFDTSKLSTPVAEISFVFGWFR